MSLFGGITPRDNNMTKNRLYIAIFTLLFVLVILLGIANFLSTTLKNKKQTVLTPLPTAPLPTSIILSPTSVSFMILPSPSLPRTTIFDLAYPLKYEGLIIDYVQPKSQIIVYYPSDIKQGQEIFNRFLIQYGTKENELSEINVEYIGLTRDPNEPPAGFSRR